MKHHGLHFLLPYMKPYHGALWLGALYAVIGASASAFSPTLLGWGIDALLLKIEIRTLALYSLGLIGLATTLAIFRYLLRMLTGQIAAGISYSMSQDFFHQVLLFDQQTRQEYGTGDLLSRAANDFIYIWRFYSAGFQMSIHSLFLLLIGSGLMAISSPMLALVVIGLLVISIGIQLYLGPILEEAFQRVQQEMAKISAFAQEHLNAARMLIAYRQEAAVGVAFQQINQAYVQRNLKFVLWSGVISPIPSIMVRLAATLIMLVGGILIINQQLTLGQYVQFIIYLSVLNHGAQQITGAFERLQQGSAAAARIGEILHRSPRIADAPDALEPTLEGHIHFENVGIWSYDQNRWILRHIDLDIPNGATIGIVGATGAGKSMLISLLGRIYEPDEGRILLDGYDLRQIKLAALRRSVIYVPQETLLFSMPLRSNIALGVPATPDPQVFRATERARLAKDLPQLPKGLSSLVGERGATLSGGQKQRTALARALVRDPKVLLLDDSLSSVDMQTSAEIIAELRQARSGCTCIIISQRMAAVKDADEIIVLDHGTIVERGTHEQLMALGGRYAAFYQREVQQAAEAIVEF